MTPPARLRMILIRHAKSDWSDPFQDDHGRTLNARGRASATAIGRWLAQKGYLPDEVLSSDATRTLETMALILPELPNAPQIETVASLYHASPDTMLDVLRQASGRCVAMIGHNPGIGGFACGIVALRPDHPRYADYPTAATAILEFDVQKWDEVQPSTARLIDFVTPRELL